MTMAQSVFQAMTISLLVSLFHPFRVDSAAEVLLRVNITTKQLILHCEVPASGIGTTTHLYCPLTGRSPCFEDCVRSCILVGGRCKPLQALKTTYCSRRQERDTIITSYTLDAKDRKNKGEWYCVHGGRRSSGFYLNIDKLLTTKRPTTTTAKPTTTTAVKTTTTTKTPLFYIARTSPRMSPYERKEDYTEIIPVPKSDATDDLIKRLTRPDLVIAILSLLALSLIVNLAFCIRCILVRKYIEIQRNGAKESACLSACLCISRSQPDQTPPKVPRDCIYEEITTSPGSATRGRRLSNCSSTQRTFSTTLDGATPTMDGRSTFNRRGSMPRSRTFPVKAVALPAQTLHQRPSYIYVAAAENGGMLLEPVLTASSRVSSQQLYDDVASDGLQSLTASTNAIYARVQRASQQLQQRQAQQDLQQHLNELHEKQQQQLDLPPRYLQPHSMSRKQTDSLPPPLAEQQEDELTPLTGSPVHSVIENHVNRPGSAGTRTGTPSGAEAKRDDAGSVGTDRGRSSASPHDLDVNAECPRNNSRLELSKSLLQKADTLLREAGCLLD